MLKMFFADKWFITFGPNCFCLFQLETDKRNLKKNLKIPIVLKENASKNTRELFCFSWNYMFVVKYLVFVSQNLPWYKSL